ncbi:aminodeoxychorismate/anthranilate synthase component II [Candidatus Pelagibacter communis]|uniref:aminodeoxychorismate/anthranilate synthase component II n=1 Tax=Candidatus Pelagibacter TaxID=198251 RepID=UPI00094C272A|nr:aminodeoxychorismate/anthranilate synthase component II [Candidatus Pelagibacter ubique]
MIYIIDHQDSFTWNVVHQFAKFDKVICANYYEVNDKSLDKSDAIVLSPGPGSPKDYPTTSKIYKKYKGKKKIIGICLGYQMILYNEGGKIIQQKRIYHGFQSKIKTNNQSKIFKNNQQFKVGRYHSLKLMEPFKSNSIKITMRCSKTKIPMGLEDNKNKIYGFQFHPESFLTENGNTLIKKILSA